MSKPLIEATKIEKSFGTDLILDGVDFRIGEGEKIALIGRNGAGKSTLFKILTGDLEADLGNVTAHKNAHIGILNQHEVLPENISTLEFLMESSGKEEWQVQKMCSNFDLVDYLPKAPTELSGGYQMRVKLVKMLLNEPNLLMLDEPVNYLDLQTLILLEDFLKSYRHALLVIAHDRTFLENTCDKTAEIEAGSIFEYNGKVSEYLIEKEENAELRKKHNKKLAKEIKRQQRFIDRFRAKPTFATRVQSRVKHVDKLKRRLMAEDISFKNAQIKLPKINLSTGPALRIKSLSCGYDGQSIIQVQDLDLMRGDKVLIAGDNGQGKSTFLKTVAEVISPVQGEYKWWHRTDIGYYDQKTRATMVSSETVSEYLERMAPKETHPEHILMMAGNFLFTGHDLDKKVEVLSGGESARLALAGILLQPHNTLILDEPTNHLDVETSDLLLDALKRYEGTVIFVSHSQSFAEKLADKIYLAEDGSLKMFMGDYDDYVSSLHDKARLSLDIPKEEKRDQRSNNERREIHLEIRVLQRQQQKTQDEIDKLEAEKSKILDYFFKNPTEHAPEKSIRLDEIEKRLLELEKEWFEKGSEIDTLREKL